VLLLLIVQLYNLIVQLSLLLIFIFPSTCNATTTFSCLHPSADPARELHMCMTSYTSVPPLLWTCESCVLSVLMLTQCCYCLFVSFSCLQCSASGDAHTRFSSCCRRRLALFVVHQTELLIVEEKFRVTRQLFLSGMLSFFCSLLS
jgi:hypothetical protein